MEKPIDILLVEDNPGDVRLTMEVLKDCRVPNKLNVVTDGAEAIDYLLKNGKYETAPRPDLILLDLNLPKKEGKQVLTEIKCHSHLRCIPVVILTTSTADEDIQKSYELYANCYISKPAALENFVQVVRSIENFWLSIVKLPLGEMQSK